MSSITSMATTKTNNNDNNDKAIYLPNEWVEIVEPRTKQRIYANLDTGICAKDPPEGAIVSRSEDFKDHWWELYDQKTGKYYYYNPEQQKTVWSKPKESNTNGTSKEKKKLLIIPVSRLQTFKKVSHNEQSPDKCDASTQTIASNLVSTGTQTISESVLEDEFNNKLNFIDLSNESSKSSSSCTHSCSNNIKSTKLSNHRQVSDFNGRNRATQVSSQIYKSEHRNNLQQQQHFRCLKDQEFLLKDIDKSSQQGNLNNVVSGNYPIQFGPYHSVAGERPPISIKSPSRYNNHTRTNEDYVSATSTFANHPSKPPINNNDENQHQKLATNNLSHYLVREARAMGIALISDDEFDDDELDSEEDCVVDEDEDTDLRDDISSHRDDINQSQDLGEESSEGWKSFSDPDSPNSVAPKSLQSMQKSSLHCETSQSFTFNNLLDDEKNPASCLSQQLDHQKLVENFKKSRQSSSFGLQDSLARSYKMDSNQAVQKIKSVADSYFHNENKDNPQMSDRHLRQLSTLSTLPRPHKETKDRIALSKQEDNNTDNLDADYDVVEENCGYYSDTDQKQQFNNSSLNTSNKSCTKLVGEPKIQNSNFDRNRSSRGSTFSVESFARENLTRHPKKGGLLFNRKVKWSRMITWTKSSIKQPMISSVNSDCTSDAIASFKLIQQFMNDRKITITKKYRQILLEAGMAEETINKVKSLARTSSISSSNKDGHYDSLLNIPDRLKDELAYELVVKGCTKSALRDEIYIQLARQLTENPNQESIRWGLVLMSIILSYFSPSSKFSPFLLSFLESHTHQMAQDVCLPRLEKRLRQNWLTYCRKPADGREISIIRLSITKWPQYCGVFGESLERLMSLQSCSQHLKTLRLPWILTTLGDKLIETGGAETEGIFRCAADHDLIAQLRLEIDCVDFRKITDAKQVHSLLSNVTDPHVIAGLLKLFFRQLYEPVFPMSIYDMCLQNGHDGQMACRIFDEHLPNLNKDVVAYLIRLLQTLSKSDNVTLTKMDNSNLSMVWAPNLLRSPNSQQYDNNMGSQHLITNNNSSKNGSKWSISNGQSNEEQNNHQVNSATTSNNMTQVGSTQSSIFEQTRQEMQFIRSLIVHLETSFIQSVR